MFGPCGITRPVVKDGRVLARKPAAFQRLGRVFDEAERPGSVPAAGGLPRDPSIAGRAGAGDHPDRFHVVVSCGRNRLRDRCHRLLRGCIAGRHGLVWPNGRGKPGASRPTFSGVQGGRARLYPRELMTKCLFAASLVTVLAFLAAFGARRSPAYVRAGLVVSLYGGLGSAPWAGLWRLLFLASIPSLVLFIALATRLPGPRWPTTCRRTVTPGSCSAPRHLLRFEYESML